MATRTTRPVFGSSKTLILMIWNLQSQTKTAKLIWKQIIHNKNITQDNWIVFLFWLTCYQKWSKRGKNVSWCYIYIMFSRRCSLIQPSKFKYFKYHMHPCIVLREYHLLTFWKSLYSHIRLWEITYMMEKCCSDVVKMSKKSE